MNMHNQTVFKQLVLSLLLPFSRGLSLAHQALKCAACQKSSQNNISLLGKSLLLRRSDALAGVLRPNIARVFFEEFRVSFRAVLR
jgi:hypothetical protein